MRRLHASETMGGANEVCTDKTGTLTQNKMTVMGFWGKEDIHYDKPIDESDQEYKNLVAECVAYNCTAHIESNGDNKVAKGNVTEVGLINHLMRSQVKVETLLQNKETPSFLEFTIPFSSSRKRATSAIRNPRLNGSVHVFCKGAPEIVIELCDRYINKNGEEKDLTAAMKSHIL